MNGLVKRLFVIIHFSLCSTVNVSHWSAYDLLISLNYIIQINLLIFLYLEGRKGGCWKIVMDINLIFIFCISETDIILFSNIFYEKKLKLSFINIPVCLEMSSTHFIRYYKCSCLLKICNLQSKKSKKKMLRY